MTSRKTLLKTLNELEVLYTDLNRLIVEYATAGFEGNLIDKLTTNDNTHYWSNAICSDSNYLYLVWGSQYYLSKITEELKILPLEDWNLPDVKGTVYGMEIRKNILYILKDGPFYIFNLLQNCVTYNWKLLSNVYNMTIDDNFIYFPTYTHITIYNKEGQSIKEIRIPSTELCGIANDKEYLYVCNTSKDYKILVIKKETGTVIRELGQNILKKPSSIYLYDNFIYVWDYKCITVLSIENSEIFQYLGQGIDDIGNNDGATYLANHMCVVKNRFYVANPHSRRILMFE